MKEDKAANIKSNINEQLQIVMELAQEKGSSNWLTSLPLQEHNFTSFQRCPFTLVWLATIKLSI